MMVVFFVFWGILCFCSGTVNRLNKPISTNWLLFLQVSQNSIIGSNNTEVQMNLHNSKITSRLVLLMIHSKNETNDNQVYTYDSFTGCFFL